MTTAWKHARMEFSREKSGDQSIIIGSIVRVVAADCNLGRAIGIRIVGHQSVCDPKRTT
jgi:hypothetical protein